MDALRQQASSKAQANTHLAGLGATAAIAAAPLQYALCDATVSGLQRALALSVAAPRQASYLLRTAETLCVNPRWLMQLAAAPGMAAALAALLQVTRCKSRAAVVIAELLQATDHQGHTAAYPFAAALLAAPGDAAGALLAVAAGAADARARGAALGTLQSIGALLRSHSDADTALLARCAACEPAVAAAARLMVSNGPVLSLMGGPARFLRVACYDFNGAAAASAIQGFTHAMATTLVRGRAQGDAELWTGALRVLAQVTTTRAAPPAEAAAAPGVLPALVALLNVRLDVAVVVGAAAVASPEACAALLRLPTLAALVALLRREAEAGVCRRGECTPCWEALVPAGALSAHDKRAQLAALLASAPGALAAAARQLGAAADPGEPLSDEAACIWGVLDAIWSTTRDDAALRARMSGAALPELLPAVAPALAACLCNPTPGSDGDDGTSACVAPRAAAMPPPASAPACGLTDLERDRLKRIEENEKRMAALLGSMDQYTLLKPQQKPAAAKKRAAPAPRRVVAAEDKRRSDRIRSLPAPQYHMDDPERSLRTPSTPTPGSLKARRADSVNRTPRGAGGGRNGWSGELGDCSLAAADAATDAAAALVAQLTAAGKVASAKLMSYSQVAPGFWLQLPRDFSAAFPYTSPSDIELACASAPVLADGTSPEFTKLLDGRPGVWYSRFMPRPGESNAGLSGGWRGFAIDQWLFPKDTVVFEKVDDRHVTVHIFRGADYETDETSAGALPARVLSLRGIPPTSGFAAMTAMAAAAGEGGAGGSEAASEAKAGEDAAGAAASGAGAAASVAGAGAFEVFDDAAGDYGSDGGGDEAEAPWGPPPEAAEEGEEEEGEGQGAAAAGAAETPAAAAAGEIAAAAAGGGGGGAPRTMSVGRPRKPVFRGFEGAGGRGGAEEEGSEEGGEEEGGARHARGKTAGPARQQAAAAAAASKKRAAPAGAAAGDAARRGRDQEGAAAKRRKSGGGGGAAEGGKGRKKGVPGFPGATQAQQAAADRAWAAGEEVVAELPRPLPRKTANEKQREANDDQFWVSCIKGHRLNASTGAREFLINWWFFSDAWNTWEPRENLTGTPASYEWALPMPRAVAHIK
ncbi:MAG: hypothetical protein J3K34DRAFT_487445 [Monoraphidium minutum]|nr:MAG: hypothetical protein J3K34DRAFT_487445 [Monoraphidium minutum]